MRVSSFIVGASPAATVTRRELLLGSIASAIAWPLLAAQVGRAQRIVLRSSWQTVNIGDIAHTPGMLALLEQHRPDASVVLWPNNVKDGVEAILRARFPKLMIAHTPEAKARALADCDFFLHGSGPSLVGWSEAEQARAAGKPYGFAGVTLNDAEIAQRRDLLAGARFVFCRDTDSLAALQASGVTGPRLAFGPDATFAIDLRDERSADALLAQHRLEPGQYLVAVPRLRWTPYWEIHPETVKPNPERIAENARFAEVDQAKLREGITAWVRETKRRVLLAPEMTYEVPLLRSLLFDRLPADVQPHVAVLDRYWLTAEACSVYARAAAIVSLEQHSPIMGIAAGVPSVLVRQPTDTRKGRMWYDLGMRDWVFEIDETTGAQVATRLVQIGRQLPTARALAAAARDQARQKMATMIEAVGA